MHSRNFCQISVISTLCRIRCCKKYIDCLWLSKFYNDEKLWLIKIPLRFQDQGKRCHNSLCGNSRNLLFWQKFRESNAFSKEVTKALISRNIFSMRVNFSFYHTVWRCHNLYWAILKTMSISSFFLRQNILYRNFLVEK